LQKDAGNADAGYILDTNGRVRSCGDKSCESEPQDDLVLMADFQCCTKVVDARAAMTRTHTHTHTHICISWHEVCGCGGREAASV
jgi:hypothetical protein